MISSILLFMLHVVYLRADDCTKNQIWCPSNNTPIACYFNQTNTIINYTNIDDSIRHLNELRQRDECQRLNGDTRKLQLEGYMRTSAVKTFRLNLVNHNRLCYATDLHRNVAAFYYRSLASEPVVEFKRKLTQYDDERDLITFIMNSKYIGCANNATDILCLVSYDDDPFEKFVNLSVNRDHGCDLMYSQRNLDICYLRDETIINLITEVGRDKVLEWNIELEYKAQAAVISNKTYLCYVSKYSSIDYHFERIVRYNISEVAQNILNSSKLDVLEKAVNYSIGCAVSNLKRNSFRLFCLYEKTDILSQHLDIGEPNVHGWVHYIEYIVVGLIIVVCINIVIISFYLNVLRELVSRLINEHQ